MRGGPAGQFTIGIGLSLNFPSTIAEFEGSREPRSVGEEGLSIDFERDFTMFWRAWVSCGLGLRIGCFFGRDFGRYLGR